jgi:hypothetical protein
MREKTRFAVVAAISATAGVVITAVVDRFAMKQDLEFLGIVHHEVAEGLSVLKHKIEGDENGGDDDPPGSARNA